MENIFQRICKKLTHHKHRVITSWSVGIEPTEYHYKCKLCGHHFWNYKKPTKTQQSKYYQENYNESDS